MISYAVVISAYKEVIRINEVAERTLYNSIRQATSSPLDSGVRNTGKDQHDRAIL